MGYVGQSVRRREDERLVRGDGRFVADVRRVGMLHAAVLRSPHAHARILRLDASAARLARGVVEVLTYADFPGFDFPIPIRVSPVASMLPFLQRPLASDKVRYVGEPVAVVVAESRYQAEDGLELIEVEYEPLPAVADALAAAEPGAPLLFEDQGTNVAAAHTIGYGDVERALREADLVVRTSFQVQRHTGVPLETRGLLAEYDPGREVLTVWGPAKVPHFNRSVIAQFLGLPEHRLHFVQIDVGGGFGVRGELYPEDFILPVLALRVRRPVQWLEDRKEHLLAANHSREQRHEVALALRHDGIILGLHERLWSDLGGYVRTHGATVANNTAENLSGPYRVPSYRAEVHCVVTNKTPAGTYRGPGLFESALVRERLVDEAARALGMDPAELRRRNFIPAEAMPYEVGLISRGQKMVYDNGDFIRLFERALARFDYAALREQQTRARAQGRCVGLGIGFVLDKSGPGPWECARVAVDPSGKVLVLTGVPSVGQGVETIFAQICADALGVPFEEVAVRYGDTDLVPYGLGAHASRGTVVGGSAVLRAAQRVRAKVLAVAARELEVHPDDLELRDGQVRVVGAPERALSLQAVARAASPTAALQAGFEPGLEALEFYPQEKLTYSYGVHLALVEVDVETGQVAVQRYLADHDVGRAINPRLVEGQIVGGFAQGLGAALLEELAYDERGQLLAGTLADYLLPTAVEVPPIEVHVAEESPSTLNPLGVKGVGEEGVVAAGPALANAVADALAPLGVAIAALPLTPSRLRELVRASCASQRGTIFI